jgi:hypothetical protein
MRRTPSGPIRLRIIPFPQERATRQKLPRRVHPRLARLSGQRAANGDNNVLPVGGRDPYVLWNSTGQAVEHTSRERISQLLLEGSRECARNHATNLGEAQAE